MRVGEVGAVLVVYTTDVYENARVGLCLSIFDARLLYCEGWRSLSEPAMTGAIFDFLLNLINKAGSGAVASVAAVVVALTGYHFTYVEPILVDRQNAIGQQIDEADAKIADLIRSINAQVDGYVIPYAIDLDEVGATHEFQIPVNTVVGLESGVRQDRPQERYMRLFADAGLQRRIEDNLSVQINGFHISTLAPFFARRQRLTHEDYFDDFDQDTYKVQVRIDDQILNDVGLSSLRNRKLFFLFTHRAAPLTVPARDENLPP